MTLRRKLAIATWTAPKEGNIYGKVTLDATEALKYLEHLRETTGEKVTITHLVGKAAGLALAHAPSLNGRVVLDRFVPFKTVDIAYLVALEGGNNLGRVKVERANEKSVVEIARELHDHAGKLAKGEDEAFKKSMAPLRWMPRWLLKRVLRLVGFLGSGLGWRIGALGVEPFPFGSCIVTSVGMLGFDEGYAPPTPFARVPIYVLVGAVKPRPAAVNGEVVVRDMVTVTATIDHRVVDGYQLGVVARVFREVFENPWSLDGEPRSLPAGDKVGLHEERDAAKVT
jgi:pyruvate dehydrogenase E2 component (dihydrolipoamide acetyltransferase)